MAQFVQRMEDLQKETEIAEDSREVSEALKLNQAMEWAAEYLCDADIADLDGFSYNEYGLTKVK